MSRKDNRFIGWVIIAGGLVGLLAAWVLTIEKLHKLANPDEGASCDFSIVVQCGKNLQSWQGALFGFPNPLLGLLGWTIVIVFGAGLVSKAHFPRWWFKAVNIGLFVALGFCIWVMSQSIFVLGTLCIWCMVTWATTIALTWTFTLWNVKEGKWGQSAVARRRGRTLYGWTPTFILFTYLTIALIAQLQLDWISYL